MAFCIRGDEGCLGPYTRRKIYTETIDEYGTTDYTWEKLFENREVGISYKNAK